MSFFLEFDRGWMDRELDEELLILKRSFASSSQRCCHISRMSSWSAATMLGEYGG
jgi:hypothetical protein